MSKYALIVTADIKLLPGVMAIINGVRYYGNDVDVYLLYWAGGLEGTFERKLDNLKAQGEEYTLLREITHVSRYVEQVSFV